MNEIDVYALFEHCQKCIDSGNDVNLFNQVIEKLRILSFGATNLFSKNESIDDLSTFSIKYMLVDLFLGLLFLSYPKADERITILQDAEAALCKFLERCVDYDLFTKEQHREYQKKTHNEDTMLSRADIISQHKELKLLEEKIADLLQHKKKDRTFIRRIVEDIDDESTRELQLNQLKLYILEAFKSLRMIRQELLVLTTKTNDRRESPQIPTSVTITRESMQPLFSEILKREMIKDNVFKPSFSQPTMSLQEFAEWEQKNGGRVLSNQAKPVNDDSVLNSDEESDIQMLKLRENDEFRERVPCGSGNTFRRG